MTIKYRYLQLGKHLSQELRDRLLSPPAHGSDGLHRGVPAVATGLGGPDSINATANYVSLSPPAAKMEGSPEVQLLAFLSSLCSLSRGPIHPHCLNVYLPVGKERI